jgi:hypothetical protein
LHAKFRVRASVGVKFASLHVISGDRSSVGLLPVALGVFLIDKGFMTMIRHGLLNVCTQICTSFARAHRAAFVVISVGKPLSANACKLANFVYGR